MTHFVTRSFPLLDLLPNKLQRMMMTGYHLSKELVGLFSSVCGRRRALYICRRRLPGPNDQCPMSLYSVPPENNADADTPVLCRLALSKLSSRIE